MEKRTAIIQYYDILQNEAGELMFAVKHFGSPLDSGYKPRIYYDGGHHALFIKNHETAMVCDYIHQGVRDSLRGVKEALVAELGDGSFVEEYMVDVIQCENLWKTADELMIVMKETGD
jgi:hypothetical protein